MAHHLGAFFGIENAQLQRVDVLRQLIVPIQVLRAAVEPRRSIDGIGNFTVDNGLDMCHIRFIGRTDLSFCHYGTSTEVNRIHLCHIATGKHCRHFKPIERLLVPNRLGLLHFDCNAIVVNLTATLLNNG